MVIYNLTGGFGFSFDATQHSWQFNLRYKFETDKGIITGSLPLHKHPTYGIQFNHSVIQGNMGELHSVLLTSHNEFVKSTETLLVIQSTDKKQITECFKELCDKIGYGY
jgi:hypothetical protein